MRGIRTMVSVVRMRWWTAVLGLTLTLGFEAPAGVLRDVAVDSGTPVRIRLRASTTPVPWARALPAAEHSPPRVYIDLVDTVLSPAVARQIEVDRGGLARVRTGQFTATTARIVLDLSATVPYEIETQGTEVTITLGTPADPPPAERPPPAPPALPHPPAEPPRAAPSRTLPLIVVDAGHGGHDPGAEGVDGALEKVIVLQVAHRLAAKLPARLPVDSLLTRSDDSFIPLPARLQPRAEDATLFVSLHANACDDPRPRGLEIYYGAGNATGPPRDSATLAERITSALRARFIRVRGHPRPGPFTVLSRNSAPSVLVEIGYLTHAREAGHLRDPHYQELLTDALVDGIAAYLQALTRDDV
jgi:N-acetylmuramoyl-L-alanine amidase